MKPLKHYFKGFTLVELIIVITILAILATITYISFKNYSGSARDSIRVTDIKTIHN
jgi:prepilin-type N-terminal cleavage/methylation domain-containing protein